jgi:hypothetical protein
LLGKWWAIAEKPEKGKETQRLRAAAALAKYDQENERWDNVSAFVVNSLVLENPIFYSHWSEAFRPVKNRLVSPLLNIFRDNTSELAAERILAASLLADSAAEDPHVLAELLMDADEKQFAIIYPKFKEHGEDGLVALTDEIDRKLSPAATDEAKEKLAKRQANAGVALLKMNRPESVWPLLKHSSNPRVRSYLIHRLSPLGADATSIIKRLDEEPDVTIQRALILSLGEFGEGQIPFSDRLALIDTLFANYENHPDSGIHGAAEWLLRKWGQGAKLKALDNKLRTYELLRQWGQGATLKALDDNLRTGDRRLQQALRAHLSGDSKSHHRPRERTFR